MNNVKKIRRFFVIGAIFLTIGLCIWLIPTIFLGSIKGGINELTLKGDLSQMEQQIFIDLQWSDAWWETQQATLFNPIAFILAELGVILILYGAITKLK